MHKGQVSGEKERIIKKAMLITDHAGVEESNSFGSDHFSFYSIASIEQQGYYHVEMSLLRA